MNESDESVLRSFEFSPNPDMLVALSAPRYPVARVNRALEQLLNVHREDVVGHPCGEFLPISDGAIDLSTFGSKIVECHASGRDSFWCRVDVSPVPTTDDNAVQYCLCSLHDVSEYVQLRDARTGADAGGVDSASDRAAALERNLTAEIVRAAARGSRVVVCYVRVDHLGIFDELGDLRRTADLVRMVAQRLSLSAVHPQQVGRTASGAFVVTFAGLGDAMDTLAVAHQAASAFSKAFVVDLGARRVTASVGAACFPDTASDARALLHQAAVAAYAVRRAGGNDVRVFSTAQDGDLSRHSQVAAELDGAVQRGEMQLMYQPVYSTAAHGVSGMEALIRWHNPRLGLVMPSEFIPIAEHLGIITDLGRWVLFEACAQAQRWRSRGVGDFTMSVNLSRRQVRGRSLLEDVRRALDSVGLPAGVLELEVTETAVMHQVELAMQTLGELRKMGVKLAMDDFGTGQSSLSFLGRLPINRMKIDQSFVAAIPGDVSAARICRAILSLAHEFGQSVVAEGVEHRVQLAFLERNGCEFVQGYLLGKPMTADEMLAALRAPASYPQLKTEQDAREGGILLLDDEPNVLHALARLLRRDGYRVFSASNIAKAFDILGTEAIQVVISDQRMPDGAGTDFLGRVKAMYPQTIRLILSGYADLGTVTEAINGGAVSRFLTKPWDDDELREAVRAAMRAAQAQRGDAA